MPEFNGIKVCQDEKACTQYNVNMLSLERHCDEILVETAGVLASGSKYGGGNSGFQALNLGVQFGARRIVLVGFDMRLDRGTHWHGKHPVGLGNPTEYMMPNWRKAMDRSAPRLAQLGIKVVNASPVSLLSAFEFVDFRDALTC